MQKVCGICRESLPISAFGSNRARYDGVQYACKPCMKAYLAEHHERNKAAHNARSTSHYQANREAHAVAGAAWRVANRGRERELGVAYYAVHRERIKARANTRYAEKGAEIRAKQIARNAANPEQRRVIDNRMRAKRNAAPGSFTASDVKALMKSQRGQCIGCRVDIRDEYHVDHIEALARGGTNDRINLQLLCPTCNRQKHARNPVEFMQTKGFLL